MSRSKHQTFKSVFGGKSRREVRESVAEKDPDFMELVKKRILKKEVLAERKAQKVESKTEE